MSSLVAQAQTLPWGASGPVPRILVVDDEQYMCDVCSRTLQRSGYEVITTSDPEAAVRLLNGELNFDLLLTDIQMPGMSGLDLAYVARERDPSIAIIIMTGFASKENLQQSVQRGVADFLPKPFELDQLRLAVEQALHKRSLVQDNLRLRALEQLLESSEALSATLDLPTLGSILLRVTMQQSGLRVGFVLVGTEDTLNVIARSSDDAELLPSGHQLILDAKAGRGFVLGSDVAICQVGTSEMRYGLAMALQAQGEISGVLLLCDDRPAALRAGVQEEIALLANHAGAALRNAVLYNQLDDAFQRVQELDRLKGEFISIASHELRTPLSIVLGYTTMLRDQASQGTQRDYLERVLENAHRIRDIVDDMVSLRHLETGEMQLDLEPLVLQDVIQHVYVQMQPTAEERNLQVVLDLPPQPIAFLCDKEKTLLILTHLTSNALRFTPKGGMITLRASLRPAGPLLDANGRVVQNNNPASTRLNLSWAVVEVQDTGIGVPEREQDRIFDRFYQVADSLTRDHGGTGLGLAVVRELTVALGGVVWLTSKEQQGSIFAFALPYRQR